MKRILFFLALYWSTNLFGQTSKIYTSDITNFWKAYDSVQTTKDTVKQLHFIQTIYIDNASDGLKDFMKSKNHSAKRHLNNILAFPKFWNSIRPNTLAIQTNIGYFNNLITKFQQLYPNFKQPDLYFTIGCLNSGGTTNSEKLLIGAEIATANAKTDASELNPWLQNAFKDLNGVLYLVAHEMVHTQQKPDNDGGILLARCIVEGAADFIAEILLDKETPTPYMKYGKKNEKELWTLFQKDMYGQEMGNWLYNGNDAPNGISDLGYFMGYTITKSYYDNAKDKQKAIKEIIELQYLNSKEVIKFLNKSKYKDKWQK